MALKYSVSLRPNPTDESAPKKAYGALQETDHYDIDRLCEHIVKHGSIWTEDIVQGVTLKLVACMSELLKEGNTIELGNFGNFHLTCTSKGADSIDKFDPHANIKRIWPVWTRGNAFKNFNNGTNQFKFEKVDTRKEVALAKKRK